MPLAVFRAQAKSSQFSNRRFTHGDISPALKSYVFFMFALFVFLFCVDTRMCVWVCVGGCICVYRCTCTHLPLSGLRIAVVLLASGLSSSEKGE